MSIKQELLSILILVIIPMLLGHSLCTLCKKENNIVHYFVYGTITLLAFLQFISVPLIILQKPFHIVYSLTIAFCIVFSIVGIVLRIMNMIKTKSSDTVNINVVNIICVIITVVISVYFLNQVYTHQHFDADDSRFVVNAVDMIEMDSLFWSNPATGYSREGYTMYDLNKDSVAPWAVYIAFLAKFTGIRVVSMAHTIMPLGLYVFALGTWFIFAGKVIEKDTILQCMFTILMILFAVYTSHDTTHAIYPTLTKFMLRIWQGKAVLAATGIPLLFISMFDYYRKPTAQNMIMILVCNLGTCFMSANGIVIDLAIIGAFSFIYAILNKKIMTFVKILLLLIPNVLYFALYMLYGKGGI